MMLQGCTFLLLASSVLAMDSDSETAPPDSTIQVTDHQRFIGRWRVTAIGLGGMPAPGFAGELEMDFKPDTVAVREGPKDQPEISRYKLDPTKSPAHIDMEDTKGTEKLIGIYELKGDRLRLIFTDRNKKRRPTLLNPAKNEDVIVLVLERIKK